MIGFVGIAVVFGMVFGGYLLAGGKLGLILKALPFEMIMIGGAATGAFLIGNDFHAVKHTVKDVGKVFKGPKWKSDDYRELLFLLKTLPNKIRLPWKNISSRRTSPRFSANIRRYRKTKKRLS